MNTMNTMNRMRLGALLATAILLAGCQNQAANATNGKAMIEDFGRQAFPGYEIVYASCATMDTNGDGYLRGTLVISKGGRHAGVAGERARARRPVPAPEGARGDTVGATAVRQQAVTPAGYHHYLHYHEPGRISGSR